MSLVTQQLLLQARSDRDDALRRISVGEDTPRLKNFLASANKRIAQCEKQMEVEVQAHKQRVADSAAKTSQRKSDSDTKPRQRSSLPDDMELSCCDCSSNFTFSGKDQVFFTRKNWKMPARCIDCRDAKKNVKPSGTDVICSGCKNTFFFSDAKAAVFEEKGLATPKWCSTCKAERSKKFTPKSSSVANVTAEDNV